MAAHDVVIAEVGAWRNLLDPDPVKRRDNVAYVTGRLALAEALGVTNQTPAPVSWLNHAKSISSGAWSLHHMAGPNSPNASHPRGRESILATL